MDIGDVHMATKKTISDISPVGSNSSPVAPDISPVAPNDSPVRSQLSKFETALKLIAEGDAMNKNDYSIQIAIKALAE